LCQFQSDFICAIDVFMYLIRPRFVLLCGREKECFANIITITESGDTVVMVTRTCIFFLYLKNDVWVRRASDTIHHHRTEVRHTETEPSDQPFKNQSGSRRSGSRHIPPGVSLILPHCICLCFLCFAEGDHHLRSCSRNRLLLPNRSVSFLVLCGEAHPLIIHADEMRLDTENLSTIDNWNGHIDGMDAGMDRESHSIVIDVAHQTNQNRPTLSRQSVDGTENEASDGAGGSVVECSHHDQFDVVVLDGLPCLCVCVHVCFCHPPQDTRLTV
jgi:hypothetical protein